MVRVIKTRKTLKKVEKSLPRSTVKKHEHVRERILVTAALPYINAVPHLGNLIGSVLPADVFTRFHRLRGNKVLYVCGSDAHGTPIEVAAFKAGTDPENLVNTNHKLFTELFDKFSIQFDQYGITHGDTNRKWTEHFFKRLKDNGYLKLEEQNAFYCTHDKTFRADRWVEGICPICKGLARGDQCNDCGNLLKPEEIVSPMCIVCGKPVQLRSTEHWFFDLPQFKTYLKEWVSKQRSWPENVRNYSLSFLEQLQKRPITRDIKWGFSVPGMKNKVFYVWFDAPIGYVSFTDEWCAGNKDKVASWWKSDAKIYQFLGKDNIVFHTIIFPAMLAGANEDWRLPDYIAGSEYLVARGVKFSKSKGIGLNVQTALDLRDADYWRYALISLYPDKKDTEFSLEEFRRKVNDELNDIVGNFVHRTLTFINNFYGGKVPLAEHFDTKDQKMLKELEYYIAQAEKSYQDVDLKEALKRAVELAKTGNAYVNECEPWKKVKSAKHEDKVKAAACLFICTHILKALSIMLHPIIPRSAEQTWSWLNIGKLQWDDAYEPMKPNHKIGSPQALFKKIDDEEFVKMKETLGIKEGKPMVEIEDFEKLDIRACKILDAERVKGSDRLVKLNVDIGGGEKRQIVAGVAEVYKAEELKGKMVAAIVNLKPAMIKGVESQGMILAAVEKDKPVLLTLDKAVQPGTTVM